MAAGEALYGESAPRCSGCPPPAWRRRATTGSYHAIRREPGAAQLSTFRVRRRRPRVARGQDPSLFSTLIAPLSLFVAQQVGERDAAAARGNLEGAQREAERAAADG